VWIIIPATSAVEAPARR